MMILYSELLFNNYTRSPQGLRVNSPRGEAEWSIDPWPSSHRNNLRFLVKMMAYWSNRVLFPDRLRWYCKRYDARWTFFAWFRAWLRAGLEYFRNFLWKKSWSSHFLKCINAWPFTNTYTNIRPSPPTFSTRFFKLSFGVVCPGSSHLKRVK